MKIARLYTTEAGVSRFQEIEVPMAHAKLGAFKDSALQTKPCPSPSVRLIELPQGLSENWHNASARQIVMVLSGVIEFVTDTDTRRCSRGEALIAEDMTGRGHLTSVIEGPARVMIVLLPPNFDLSRWSS